MAASRIRGAIAAAAVLALAACSTTGPIGGGGGGVDFALGSTLGASLTRADQRALGEAFGPALQSGAGGAAARWRGPGGAEGAITPGAYYFGNLRSDPRELIPLAGPALSFAFPLEIEQGEQVTTRNANVRSAPQQDAPVLEKLDAGVGVDAVGKVVGQPFYLVAARGKLRGYVHESLLTPAPGAEIALAGGPKRTPHPCRAFSQTLLVGGQSDKWSGFACDRGQGWRPEPRSQGAPAIL